MKVKLKSKQIAVSLMLCLFFSLIPAEIVQAEEEKKTLDIMFTSDTHSHLNSFQTVFRGKNQTIGGFARIKTLIDKQKEKNAETLILDGGDFSMGTLVQTVYMEEAAELRMLGEIGCDAVTIGNHEFDYRSEGLHDMLKAAVNSGERLPAFVLCNVDWEAMEPVLTQGQELLKDSFDEYGIKPYTMIRKGDVNAAVIGVFGTDALATAPTCELIFADPVESVKKTVTAIQENEDADIIICLSHGGTNADPKKSEDEILAKKVPGLDLILSGHSHTSLDVPIIYNDTYIVSCGEYGEELGSISLRQKDNGRWEAEKYELLPVTEDITPEEKTKDKIDGFYKAVDKKYLSGFGYTRDEILAYNPYQFSTVDDLYSNHGEENLGNIISDAYVYAADEAKSGDDTPVSVAVAPSGTIRDTYVPGNVTVEDVFNSFSLGIGKDRIAGYPLVSVYLSGSELKTMAEIDASVSDYMQTARLYWSGFQMTYNPYRLILNKVTDTSLVNRDGSTSEIVNDKLYRIVSDMYTGQMLSAVTDMSYGILSVKPKFQDGTQIENLEDAILYDGNKEVKAWAAIAAYMQSFEKAENGISQIPEYYNMDHGRKERNESKKLSDILKSPNKYAFIIIGLPVIALAVIVPILVHFTRWIKNKIFRKKSSR